MRLINKGILLFVMVMLAGILSGCAKKEIKIGVSFGVGAAARWNQEKIYMEEHAAEKGVQIEVRINRTDEPKTQEEDCYEMIDSGIDVLLLTPRDVRNTRKIMDYAKKKGVPIINYARVILKERPNLYVGYDSTRIGQQQGQYLTELVYEGDYIVLRGDDSDYNSQLVYEGAMSYINELDNIHVILDAHVPDWSVDEAKRMVMEAITANGNKVDAILAPNDKLAGASADALTELGIKDSVKIIGMDAELEAAQRIIAGTQSATIYMDLEELASTAIDEAILLANKKASTINAEFDNLGDTPINANLITGKLVTKENLDKFLIDSGYFTHEQVYN